MSTHNSLAIAWEQLEQLDADDQWLIVFLISKLYENERAARREANQPLPLEQDGGAR